MAPEDGISGGDREEIYTIDAFLGRYRESNADLQYLQISVKAMIRSVLGDNFPSVTLEGLTAAEETFNLEDMIKRAASISERLMRKSSAETISGDSIEAIKILKELDTLCKEIRIGVQTGRITEKELTRILNEGFVKLILLHPFVMSSFFRTDASSGVPVEKIAGRYAGSNVLMEMIRAAFKKARELKWNELCLFELALAVTPPAIAIMERARDIAQELCENLPKGADVKFLELAGGGGEGTICFLNAIRKRLEARDLTMSSLTVMDSDPTQKRRAETRIGRTLGERETPRNLIYDKEKGNVAVQQNLTDAVSEVKPNVVLSIGLADYFDREGKVKFIRDIISASEPGALIAIGVFKDEFQYKDIMTFLLNWFLKTTSSEELAAIGKEAGLEDVRVLELPNCRGNGCQNFLVGRVPSGVSK
ncbi:MAG: hypothetical protein WC846_01915 [Candidatus Gracilibacteria bacterium]|jgi:hypothetical protein